MNDRELWELFCKKNGVEVKDYATWAFSGNSDKQLKAVLSGDKTMTESLFDLYELEGEPLPQIGNYSVILDSNGDAKCIIKNVNVRVVPFNEITASDAKKSGEDLAHWREVRREDFYQELNRSNIRFEDTMKIVLEEFEVVFVG